jgi:hypothetical protein
MKTTIALTTITLGLLGPSERQSHAAVALDQMPATLETRFALSALPPGLRDQATVYLLDPAKGYRLTRQGTNGLACLVERTVWEWAELQLRDDIYIPLCYDAAGAKAHLRVMIDVAELRAKGMSAEAIKSEVERRYRSKIYSAPTRPGLSYMIAPLFRALGPPDMKMHTMAMPHVMFYAPGVTNEDIGARPSFSDHASLQYPFIDRQGNAEQSYMIQMVGQSETARILADEKALLADLCAYRDVLCLPESAH